MTDNVANNKRIFKNTMLLYFRMLIMMCISLYTSRIILSVLGVNDYGIYNVIGGVVAMFSIISGAISGAISRYVTYELGKNNIEKLKVIFSTSINIQIGMCVLIGILAEFIGTWFLDNKMVISPDRLQAAHIVLQCSIITFLINLISLPYNATIIAHEKMSAFAYISIIEVILKLIAVFTLYISPIDKLELWAILLMTISIIIRLIYGNYCKKNFEECSYHFIWNKKIFLSMISFSGWSYVGAIAGVCRTQGINIILNLFFGPVVNAAIGVANQVNNAVHAFVNNFMAAVNPQITKSFASGNIDYMIKLIFMSSRFSFYLLLLLSLPLIIEVDYILKIWLGNVPQHSNSFVRLILIFALWEELATSLITSALAYGSIKKYQLTVGLLNLLNLPVSYLLLKLGFFPEITMYVSIILSHLCLFVRVYLLKDMIGISMKKYFFNVYLNVTLVALISFIIPYLISSYFESNFFRFIAITIVSIITTIICILFIGCNKTERDFLQLKIKEIINKKFLRINE